ncbi:MAG TPA: SH3 domain-containing protein, partial [Allosphingosinicella sp.]
RFSARLAAVSAERIPWAAILVGAVTLVSVTAFVLILSFVTRREQPVPATPTQQADSARPVAQFVTARLLRCRSAPARQARPVRTFRRGTRVDMLALDGDWASISHRGRQCWVAARYLSTERPL